MDRHIFKPNSTQTTANQTSVSSMSELEREDCRRMYARHDKRIAVISKEIEIVKEGISDMLEIINTLKELIKTYNGTNKKRKMN